MKIIQSQSSSSSSSSTTTTTTTTSTTTTTQQIGQQVSSASGSDFQEIELSDGSRYRLYPDGVVTNSAGKIVSTTGIAGFEQYLSTFTVIRTIVRTVAPEYAIAVANGVEYFVFYNGTVTTTTGVWLSEGGVEGLKKYLGLGRTTTTTQTIVPDFQIVNANGVDYHLYTNGSSYTVSGVFVSFGGVEGLKAYLVTLQ